MFGDNLNTQTLASFLLELYPLEDLLTLNDVTEEELVVHLLEIGFIAEPRGIIQGYEQDEEAAEQT